MEDKKTSIFKLAKAVLLITAAPITVLLFYAIMGRINIDHSLIGILAILVATTFFIHPYIMNIGALTDYVNKLAEDKTADEPDLSFLNNLEELSDAVENLNRSWENRKNQLEGALAENKIVIEVLPDAIFILDAQQRIVRTNGMARHFFGHRLSGKPVIEVLPVDSLIEALDNVTQVREVEFTLEGDIKRDYIAKLTKFPSNSPSLTDTILTLHDLTEVKQIRRMRADFVANASHEMKTPLASIIGLIETMQTSAKADPEAQKEFLGIMGTQAERMKTLITDLLSLSKIQSDTSPPETKADIAKILQEVKKYCDVIAKQKNVKIKIKVQEDLPQIIADEEQLNQVFTNLISNSIKYGYEDSKVEVNAEITRKLPIELNDKFDKGLVVTVKDKSDGIPEEHLPRLTERFYRVDSARSKKLGGTGLGLAIVKHILIRHNGILKIESKKNVGSEFKVYLPIPDDNLLLQEAVNKTKSDDNDEVVAIS